jgi:hypothetical protein
MPPEHLHGKHIFVIRLEHRTLDVQEEDGYNNSLSFRMGRDPIPELSKKEVSEQQVREREPQIRRRIKQTDLNMRCTCVCSMSYSNHFCIFYKLYVLTELFKLSILKTFYNYCNMADD